MSSIYLVVKRKERLAMESILKDRVTLSANDYGDPAFTRSSNEIIFSNGNLPDQSAVYSRRFPENVQMMNNDIRRDDQGIQNNQVNGLAQGSQTIVSYHPNDQSLRNSNTSNESSNSSSSTGWTNPLFLNAQQPDNNRPATYAMIEEECYSGSNQSGIYTSIPEYFQTLEGFDVGESNDYDSFSSGEFEQEAVYENGSVTQVTQPTKIKSVYLHTPCQSMESILIPIQEENNYEYVSDNCDKVEQNGELEYDYVANDDEMFSNRESSVSSQLENKPSDDALYEDTDSPNTTLDTTAEHVHNEDNPSLTYDYTFDEYPHNYDYAANPSSSDYYEDGTSINLHLNGLPDEYDYVSDANMTPSLENIDHLDNTPRKQSSVDEEYTGPTTYYDDVTLLAMSGDLDDSLGELPEYEYVRNSNITETSNGTDRTSNISDITISAAAVDKNSRTSAVSYASIDGSDSGLSADEHDYDEISKRTVDNVNNESEGEYDSDYEKVNDVLGRKSVEIKDIDEQQQDVKSVTTGVTYQTPIADKECSIIIVDNEPLYDEVCSAESGEDQISSC